MTETPRTLLVVVPNLAEGGAQRAATWLAREWSRSHRVVMAVFDAGNAVHAPGGELEDLRTPPARGAWGKARVAAWRVLRLRALLRRLRPDAVFGFMESANLPLILAAASCGRRGAVTLSVRGNPAAMRDFHAVCVRALYPLAGCVAAVSRGAAGELARRFPELAPRIAVLYSGLPLESVRAQAALPPEPVNAVPDSGYLFAAGRLVPGKDFARMIRLFAEMGGDLHLVIAGDGPERPSLQALIQELGVDDRVHLPGRVQNPFAWMARARALLMTSRHEGFPMNLIEALACGCPVVAFDCPYGPAEVLEGMDAGFVVPMDDDAGFVACLRRLASDSELRARMSAVARVRAADFDVSRTAPRWLAHREGV